jgi:hypothetical protein
MPTPQTHASPFIFLIQFTSGAEAHFLSTSLLFPRQIQQQHVRQNSKTLPYITQELVSFYHKLKTLLKAEIPAVAIRARISNNLSSQNTSWHIETTSFPSPLLSTNEFTCKLRLRVNLLSKHLRNSAINSLPLKLRGSSNTSQFHRASLRVQIVQSPNSGPICSWVFRSLL